VDCGRSSVAPDSIAIFVWLSIAGVDALRSLGAWDPPGVVLTGDSRTSKTA
jgi:hypothetical protein